MLSSKPASLFIKILVHYCSIVRHCGRCHRTALQLHDRCYQFWLILLTLWHSKQQNLICFWEMMYINLQCEKLLCGRAANLQWRFLQPLGCPSLKERRHRILGCTGDTRDRWHFYFRILLGKQLLILWQHRKLGFILIHKREFFHKNILSLFYTHMVCLSQGRTEGSWP